MYSQLKLTFNDAYFTNSKTYFLIKWYLKISYFFSSVIFEIFNTKNVIDVKMVDNDNNDKEKEVRTSPKTIFKNVYFRNYSWNTVLVLTLISKNSLLNAIIRSLCFKEENMILGFGKSCSILGEV